MLALINTLREGVNKARTFLAYPVHPKTLMPYSEYAAWREKYFATHKDHQVEAAEALGRAFCQHFKIRDYDLEEMSTRIAAEALIFGRYVNRHREMS